MEKELVAEEEPIALARICRRSHNKVSPSSEKSSAQSESVERGEGNGMEKASSTGLTYSSGSGRSLSTITGLMTDDYTLHPFPHTRTSANKEVRYSPDISFTDF